MDGDEARGRDVAFALERAGYLVDRCADEVEAERSLDASTPDLLVLRAELPAGPAHELLEVLHRAPPAPAAIVVGRPSAESAFRLGAFGVRGLVADDATPLEIAAAVRRALLAPNDPAPLLRGCVGAVPLGVLEGRVRALMVDEALLRAHGNRHEAARLLCVSRQMLQQWLRRSGRAPAGARA